MSRLSHHSTSKVGRRRSQLALSKRTLTVCAVCKGPALPHKMCMQCGAYPKKKVKNVKSSTS